MCDQCHSMKKVQLLFKKNYRGFSLVDVILAVCVFGLIFTALVGVLIFGHQSTALAGERTRATMLADEGLEAVRNIRDENFSNLTEGTHGLAISGNQWTLSGTSDKTDIFTRRLVISSVGVDRKQIVATVSWPQLSLQQLGSVELTAYLTAAVNPGDVPLSSCSAYCESLPAGYTDGTCRDNSVECTTNGEIYESGGDEYCTGLFTDICCCAP